MSKINWLDKLGWTEEQLEDLQVTGYAYIRQGKYDIALDFFEALYVLDPDNPYNAETLGALHLQLDNPAKALKYFDHALKLNPKNMPTLLNLTKALFMLGKTKEGIKIANILQNEPDLKISNPAKALLLAFS